MSDNNKPPLGVSPHWFVFPERMGELNQAIERFLQYAREHRSAECTAQKYDCIALWAEELKALASLEAKLQRMEGSKHQ